MAGRMVFGAQDANRIVDLDHLVVLISTTTSGIDRKRILIDDLWGLISDLKRLVSWRHELRRKVRDGGLWRCIEFGNHIPSHLPEERQVLFGVLVPNIVNECTETLVKIVSTDLFELS